MLKHIPYPKTLGDVSKHRQFLYGFAALWIIFFHMRLKVPIKGLMIPLGFIQATGGCGVEIFLLLTGFGLYGSMNRDPDVMRFYSRRFVRVFLPSFILVAISKSMSGQGLMDFLGSISLFGYWLGASVPWYVAFILTMYLIYPALYNIQKKRPGLLWASVVVAVLASGMLEFMPLQVPAKILLPLSRVPVFLFGCALAPMVYENRKIPRWIVPAAAVTVVALILVAARSDVLRNSYFYCCTLIYIPYSIIVVLVVSTIASLLSCGRLRGMIYHCVAFCGMISLELYLCHTRTRSMLAKIPGAFTNLDGRIKLEIAAILCTFVLSVALQALVNYIIRLFSSVRMPAPEEK